MYTADPNNTTVSTLTSGWDSLGLCQCFYGNGVVASLLDNGSQFSFQIYVAID